VQQTFRSCFHSNGPGLLNRIVFSIPSTGLPFFNKLKEFQLHILTSGKPSMPDSESLYIEFLFSTGKKLGSRSSSKLWRLESFYRSCLAQAQENVPQIRRKGSNLRHSSADRTRNRWNHLQECRCVCKRGTKMIRRVLCEVEIQSNVPAAWQRW
jgi:ribosomal protein L35